MELPVKSTISIYLHAAKICSREVPSTNRVLTLVRISIFDYLLEKHITRFITSIIRAWKLGAYTTPTRQIYQFLIVILSLDCK